MIKIVVISANKIIAAIMEIKIRYFITHLQHCLYFHFSNAIDYRQHSLAMMRNYGKNNNDNNKKGCFV
jgi:hypothetical protein